MKRILMLTAVLALFLGGCKGPREFILSGEEGSKSVAVVAVGEEFSLKLSASLSTGYAWHAEYTEESIAKISDGVITAGGDITGAPDVQVITFKALKSGGAIISLKYKNPSGETVKSCDVGVEIK